MPLWQRLVIGGNVRWTITRLLILLALTAVAGRYFFPDGQARYRRILVDGHSMHPTFENGQSLWMHAPQSSGQGSGSLTELVDQVLLAHPASAINEGQRLGILVGNQLHEDARRVASERAAAARLGARLTFISSLEVSPSPSTDGSVSDMKRTLSRA